MRALTICQSRTKIVKGSEIPSPPFLLHRADIIVLDFVFAVSGSSIIQRKGRRLTIQVDTEDSSAAAMNEDIRSLKGRDRHGGSPGGLAGDMADDRSYIRAVAGVSVSLRVTQEKQGTSTRWPTCPRI